MKFFPAGKQDSNGDSHDVKGGFFPLHPFIFCLLPVLAMLQIVKEVVMPETILPTVIALEIETAIVLLIWYLCTRDLYKSALFTTVLNFLLFFYTDIENLVKNIWPEAPAFVVLAVHALLTFCLISGLSTNNWSFGKKDFKIPIDALSAALNPVSAVLLLINAYPVIAYYIQIDGLSKDLVAHFQKLPSAVQLDTRAPRPDIYYIIVDGCAHPQTLKHLCHHDNSRFLTFLKNKGFYVAEEAFSNYDRTEYSLSSSLNMQYLDIIPQKLGSGNPGYFVEWRLAHNNCLLTLLHRLGYKFVNICSFSTGTDFVPTADQNWRTSFGNHFMIATALLTPLRGLEGYVPILRDIYAFSQLNQGNALRDVIKVPGPKFVFLHTELTHPPYLFDENGNRLPLPIKEMQSAWRSPVAYGQQVAFAEKELERWIDTILAKSEKPPVILIQADHGPGPFPGIADAKDPGAEPGLYAPKPVRMKILSAYLLPQTKTGDGNSPYAKITPVNSFRVVLNQCFSTNLPMLPDKALFPEPGKQYDWKDISGQINFEKNP